MCFRARGTRRRAYRRSATSLAGTEKDQAIKTVSGLVTRCAGAPARDCYGSVQAASGGSAMGIAWDESSESVGMCGNSVGINSH